MFDLLIPSHHAVSPLDNFFRKNWKLRGGRARGRGWKSNGKVGVRSNPASRVFLICHQTRIRQIHTEDKTVLYLSESLVVWTNSEKLCPWDGQHDWHNTINTLTSCASSNVLQSRSCHWGEDGWVWHPWCEWRLRSWSDTFLNLWESFASWNVWQVGGSWDG